MDSVEEIKNNAKRFNKVVIWGLKYRFHTHRYIFLGYYKTLKKLGVPVIWLEDVKRNNRFIEKNDLVISAEVVGRMVPEKKSLVDYKLRIRDDVYYCLHNYKELFWKNIRPEKLLRLQVYVNYADQFKKLYEGVCFDGVERVLYQPWGTDLLPSEFKKPVFNSNRLVFWVGSVWNNKLGHGNKDKIFELKRILKNNKIIFFKFEFVPQFLNRFLIRFSRLAPAIAGNYQVETNYLPCRMFKNISYGQLGFSNVKKFNDIFMGCNIYNSDMEMMVEKVLSLNEVDYLGLIGKQQEVCKKYTCAQHLNNIFTNLI